MTAGSNSDHTLNKRIIVAVVCAPVIVWIFLLRGIPLYVFIAGLTALGQWELYSMFGDKVRFPHKVIGHLSGLLIITDAFITHSDYFFSIVVVVLFSSFTIELFCGKENRLECITLSLLAVVYPAAFIAFLFKIESLATVIFTGYSHYVLVFILIVIWIFDTASYFVGRAVGKHPFFPGISPKKTVEGFVGGIVAVALTGLGVGSFINLSLLGHFILLSVLIGLSGQAGDLSESIIKRDMLIKDSSNIIPGHGGILDRFDSLFFAAPVVYAYLLVFSVIFN